MRYLEGKEEQEAIKFMKQAAVVAQKSSCLRSKCGSVIVKSGIVIGEGCNGPAGGEILHECRKDKLPPNFKSDMTCCMHAEERAIMQTLKEKGKEIEGARLYFIRLDDRGNLSKAGEPYCTICSKMSYDVGIAEFTLWHEKGICVYGSKEYNDISFASKATRTC